MKPKNVKKIQTEVKKTKISVDKNKVKKVDEKPKLNLPIRNTVKVKDNKSPSIKSFETMDS